MRCTGFPLSAPVSFVFSSVTLFRCCAVGTTKEHLGLALALKVPIFVVVTKIDLCRSCQVERTIKQLERILKSPGCKRVPYRVELEDDVITAAETFHSER